MPPSSSDVEVEKLYDAGERLSESKDKSQNVRDYEEIIMAVKGGSVKAKQLAAQLIPRFFKFFPTLATRAITALFDLVEEEELAVRVHAIRGLPLLCKENPEYISRIAEVLDQLLICEENVERDAVHKAIMTLLRQDVKAALTALFKHVEKDVKDYEHIREKVICFLKDKVFPLKAELLKPQAEMERFVTNLVKQSLQDVTGEEFKLFMDFLKSFSIFGHSAPPECIQELIEIIEDQADLNAQFDVSDMDHIDRLTSCMNLALPFFKRGASCGKFINYYNKHILPIFDKFPEEKKLDLLKPLAGSSPFAHAQDARPILPAIVQLLKKYMPARKTEGPKLNYLECLLYTFHHLAHKTPNSTNSLCGYKIVTGQPSDRLGEDFSENYRDFTERLNAVEDYVKMTTKKLTQAMSEHNKSMAAAKSEEAKAKAKLDQQKNTSSLRVCNNILAMVQPLRSKAPSFIGDDKITLSWMEAVKPSTASNTGAKRANTQLKGPDNNMKKPRGGGGPMQNQLVNRAFQGLSRGGGGRNSGRGRGWGNRGRGRGGYY